MLKSSLPFRKNLNFTGKWVNNSRVPRIKNANFSGYHFYMNANKHGDCQICISLTFNYHESYFPEDIQFLLRFDIPNNISQFDSFRLVYSSFYECK